MKRRDPAPLRLTVPAMGSNTETSIPNSNYLDAMRLLGLDPDDRNRALVSIHIEAGRVEAEYRQIKLIGSGGNIEYDTTTATIEPPDPLREAQEQVEKATRTLKEAIQALAGVVVEAALPGQRLQGHIDTLSPSAQQFIVNAPITYTGSPGQAGAVQNALEDLL